ncbi:MAG: hypothetical protein GY696_17470 [Gammaproteobacteria bacterium]|nr:hypothetical protein [Gammaproteobacteria bacterium]
MEKLRLDLTGPGKKGTATTFEKTLSNLRNFTENRSPLSKWVETFCQHLGNSTLVGCAHQVLHPIESFSSEEYFHSHLNNDKYNIYDEGGFYWPLPLIHILSWIMVCIAVVKGPQWMGKLVYVTAVFPIVMMMILVVFAATLEGHKLGISFYLKTNFCKLKEPKLWLVAMGQIFFSLSIGTGGLMTLSS